MNAQWLLFTMRQLAQRRLADGEGLLTKGRAPGSGRSPASWWGGEAKEVTLSSATPLVTRPEAPAPQANKKRIMDWVKDQEQFAHLPKLPRLGPNVLAPVL